MYFQSIGRNQRPRGFHVKQGFQFAFILAVFIWLLYQIKHSNDSKGERTAEAKFSEGSSIPILGRKGDLELSNKDAILEAGGKQKDRGDGDDKFYANEDEKEIIKVYRQKEYKQGHVGIDAEEKQMELERPYNQSRNSENIEIEMRDKDNEAFSEDNSLEGLENSNSINTRIDALSLRQGKDEETSSSKENSEDKELLRSETINQNEVASGSHGFDDENGVPQGGNDAVEFTLAKSRDGQGNYILQQENFTTSNHRQSKITQADKDAFKSETDATKTHSRKEGSKTV